MALAAVGAFWLGTAAVPAQAPPPAASGYWEGSIELPGTELGVGVELGEEDGVWRGTIDIPAQGLRGFALGDVEFGEEEGGISFRIPGVPGDPVFVGALEEGGRALAGEFTQNGLTFPFRLERSVRVTRRGETPAEGVPGEGFAGFWQGSLRLGLAELRLLFELTDEGGDLAGELTSIDQGASVVAFSAAAADGRELHLEAAANGGVFDGTLSQDGSEVAGEWKQSGRTFPLVLKRLAQAPDLSRPQDPEPPFPYRVEAVRFANAGAEIELAGTLTVPASDGPHPAAVLLSGSGPQDRDEAIVGHRPFLVLADHLTRAGVAVLRFDDRGVGESGGDFGQATNADFVSDALAAVAFLKGRAEIDGARIGLVGHSEGGVTAPRAAARSGEVAFIVLLAGVGVPMDELLLRQGEDIARVMGADEEMISKQTGSLRRAFALVREGRPRAEAEAELRRLVEEAVEDYTPEEREALGISEEMLESQMQMVFSPWFADILGYDPRPALREVRCPVLAINGEKDLQVAADANLPAIREALEEGGNRDVTVRAFPGLNHLFQTCQTGAVAEYGAIDETIAPEVLEAVAGWVRERTGLE